jgi:hypothetical protein
MPTNSRLPIKYCLGLLVLLASCLNLTACGSKEISSYVSSTSTSNTDFVPPTVTPPVIPTYGTLNNTRLIGINIKAPLDYEPDLTLADAIKTARVFTKPGYTQPIYDGHISGTSDTRNMKSAIDANGWPTEDFSTYVWASLTNRNGTYAFSFTGQAASITSTIAPGGGH